MRRWFLEGCLLVRATALLFGLVYAISSMAQDITPQVSPENHDHYVAAIELHTAAELYTVLQRAERLLLDGVALQEEPAPVTFVLHGPEVKSLLRQNYLKNKTTVDLAARLSALGVVDIKACETWMGGNSVNPDDLQPFVTTVIYGPAEIGRLVNDEGYIYF